MKVKRCKVCGVRLTPKMHLLDSSYCLRHEPPDRDHLKIMGRK